ncbi:hypothetical protein F2Q68_00044975 [Brassica cretica]|uniref:Uncharacterized protein n=1 Tax=Brassica cretica TaxID=69181 RepID=A0A8S9LGG7_BRACR|nr:hypothetical protein F2Q68_00044975 [Brassica cretica]
MIATLLRGLEIRSTVFSKLVCYLFTISAYICANFGSHSLSLSQEYDGVLAVVKNKLEQKKKETAAEIRLQEARARIEALTEYNEGGFELEAELERFKDLEVSLEVDYGLASVSAPSLSRLDLPEISGDSVNQD